jgi:hypothetical protein
MPVLTRPMKITFGEMRASGIRDLLIYCADYRCNHSIQMSGDRWPGHVRLSDVEGRFVCMLRLFPSRNKSWPRFRFPIGGPESHFAVANFLFFVTGEARQNHGLKG